MPQLLSDHIFSEQMRYESHRLVCTFGAETICIEGVLAAALLSALLVDTEEGKQRGIAIDTDDERKAWMMRYEREVRPDDWGMFSAEIQPISHPISPLQDEIRRREQDEREGDPCDIHRQGFGKKWRRICRVFKAGLYQHH